MSGSDDRLGAEDHGAPKPRGRPPGASTRRQPDERIAAERDYEERDNTEDREMSEDERFEMFMASQDQSVLPDLPRKPGYHVCWLTTSNPRDTIQSRLRQGYRLIRAEDCPGFEGVGLSTGDYAGVIAVNEMLAAEIPERLFQRMMAYNHHQKPLSEEEKIRAATDGIKQNAESMGAKLQEGEGMADIVQRAPLSAESFVE